jgi:formylglycine-generating enzyme required for sulfatase activity
MGQDYSGFWEHSSGGRVDFDIQSWIGWVQSLPGWLRALPLWVEIAGVVFGLEAIVSFGVSGAVLTQWAEPKNDTRWFIPNRFINDVLVRPSIGPATAWLAGSLIGLVVYLTIQYAPGAAARAAQAHGANPDEVISELTGYVTIGIVIALLVGFALEPQGLRIWRWIESWIPSWLQFWKSRESFRFLARTRGEKAVEALRNFPARFLTAIGAFVARFVFLAWRAPSLALSLIDYSLARPFAILAGATWRPWKARYALLGFWVLGGACVAWFYPAPYGLYGVGAGILAIISVVRRWNWVERDREAFLTARKANPKVQRIGFDEDLRDEALIGIVFLFLLIPLGLRQADLAFDAFDLANGAVLPATELGQVLAWMGFFGAELAKAVPLVDWSEVFHVANGSPIEPKTALGAQIVFAMRASLDLLLIAAVLQAVQIAARVRNQRSAFKAGDLPILDPFAELPRFLAIAEAIREHPHVKTIARPAIAEFPKYDEERLTEIIEGSGWKARSAAETLPARRAALALLVKQWAKNERNEDAVKKLNERLADEGDDSSLRLLALELLGELGKAFACDPLARILAGNTGHALPLRENAARWLGRLRCTAAKDTLFARLKDTGEAEAIRAQAGLALAKLGDKRAHDGLAMLASKFVDWTPGDGSHAVIARGDHLVPVMATAYGLALLAGKRSATLTPEGLADLFAEPLRPHAIRAIKSAWGEHEHMVEIPAGTFKMGAADGEEAALSTERPQHKVTIPAFEMGKYTVTFEEYDAFCAAAGARVPEDRENWGRVRRPVINVTWHDAHEYCDWLYAWTGERFRLPSEAEWEYACRAGTTTPFNFDEPISIDKVNYDGNYTYGRSQKGKFREHTVPVDDPSFQPNAWGLFHMHGNVWEWCQDAWNWNYNPTNDPETEIPIDGSPWLTGDTSSRVYRGGSWGSGPGVVRSALRGGDPSAVRVIDLGFRVARTILPL